MCVVTRDRISGRLVRLMQARDDSGKTFGEALRESFDAMTPEQQAAYKRELLQRLNVPRSREEDRWPIN
jgi:hypothetical protein